MDSLQITSLNPEGSRYTHSQIAETCIECLGIILSSETEKSPRAKHRFGFSGIHKRPKTPQTATPDEILDSLTRQAGSQTGLGEAQTKQLELLMEPEETLQLIQTEEAPPENVRNRRSLAHFAFALMLLAGMGIVWIYTRGSRFYDPAYINSLIQSAGIQRVFTDPAQVGVIFSVASLLALWVAHRRRRSDLNLLES